MPVVVDAHNVVEQGEHNIEIPDPPRVMVDGVVLQQPGREGGPLEGVVNQGWEAVLQIQRELMAGIC